MKRDTWFGISLGLSLLVAGLVSTTVGCSASRTLEGVRQSDIPTDLRADYDLFSQRCSKCHGLSRPLNAGDKSDEFWQRYVTRMRHQPGSGIAVEDEPPILRFLHYYSAQIRGGAAVGVPK